MACHLHGYKIPFSYEYFVFYEYFDNKEKLFYLDLDCFYEKNDTVSYYIYYSNNRIQIRNSKREIMFILDVFSYQELKKSLKYKVNKDKFNSAYFYDFMIGV
jgi:hypothetical protein